MIKTLIIAVLGILYLSAIESADTRSFTFQYGPLGEEMGDNEQGNEQNKTSTSHLMSNENQAHKTVTERAVAEEKLKISESSNILQNDSKRSSEYQLYNAGKIEFNHGDLKKLRGIHSKKTEPNKSYVEKGSSSVSEKKAEVDSEETVNLSYYASYPGLSLSSSLGEEIFPPMWPKYLSDSIRPVSAFPELYHRSDERHLPQSDTVGNVPGDSEVQDNISVKSISEDPSSDSELLIRNSPEKKWNFQGLSKNTPLKTIFTLERIHQTMQKPSRSVHLTGMKTSQDESTGLNKHHDESMQHPAKKLGPHVDKEAKASSLKLGFEKAQDFARNYKAGEVPEIILTREPYLRRTGVKTVFQSWLLHKPDILQPVKFFPGVLEGYHKAQPRNFDEGKRNSASLILLQEKHSSNTGGPVLFPSSIFEREVQVPFF